VSLSDCKGGFAPNAVVRLLIYAATQGGTLINSTYMTTTGGNMFIVALAGTGKGSISLVELCWSAVELI
jgi:hypothetical protein